MNRERTWSDKHDPRKVVLNAIRRASRFVRGMFTPWAVAFLIGCAVIAAAWR